jgi:transcription elongation GreA/GreB family factor
VAKTLPKTRPELLELHMAARRRRVAAALGSEEYREACEEIAAIEIRIAEIERPASPASG